MKKTLPFIALLLILTVSCTPTQKGISGDYHHKTECLGVELDGSQTLKAWGNGKNNSDAEEQAKKNAVRDVIFSGILDGKQGCEVKPLVSEANAREKYEEYFNRFFSDGGRYRRYVSLRDEGKEKRDKKQAHKSITIGMVVRVLRPELKKELIDEGILKK